MADKGVRRRRAFRHVTFVAGLAITLALVATAAVSLVYTPRDPLEMSIAGRLQGPSAAHPLGTDQFGRDLLSRIMQGAITSILVGVIAVGIGMVIGVAFGVLSGYFGGWLDETFMRLVDAIQGFPAILSALLLSAVFKPTLTISMATISFPVAILAEAGLSYLGLGTQPPNPSWGLMLKEAQGFLGLNPWYAIFPGGAIALTVLGLNLLGDGLRDVLDPKTAAS